MKWLLAFYKKTLSVLLQILFGRGCIFTPTCSEYFIQAVEKKGAVRGTLLGTRRILRCHPFYKGKHFDPVV